MELIVRERLITPPQAVFCFLRMQKAKKRNIKKIKEALRP